MININVMERYGCGLLRDKQQNFLRVYTWQLRNETESWLKSLQKVETCSTFRVDFCNLSRNVSFRHLQVMLHSAIRCLAMALWDKLHEKLHNVQAPSALWSGVFRRHEKARLLTLFPLPIICGVLSFFSLYKEAFTKERQAESALFMLLWNVFSTYATWGLQVTLQFCTNPDSTQSFATPCWMMGYASSLLFVNPLRTSSD